MPTKRRRIAPRRIGGSLNDLQRAHLLIGPRLARRFGRPGDVGFEDDDHARAMWQRHREELLANRDFTVNDPGMRPWGYWRFDVGLKVRPGNECVAVYRDHADATERAAIELTWSRWPGLAPKWFKPIARS